METNAKKRIGQLATATIVAIALLAIWTIRTTDSDSAVPRITAETREDKSLQSRYSSEADNVEPTPPTAEPAASHSEEFNWESYLIDVDNGSLHATRIQELTADSLFDELVAQLRGESSDIARQSRTKYELLFYSLSNSRNGTVLLDTLECGLDLCVVALRSEDALALSDYMEAATASEEFEARAIVSFPGSDIYSSGTSRRIIFPHNPSINSVIIPAGK